MIVVRYSYVLIITWTVCKCIMISALHPSGASRNSLGRIQSWRDGMEKKMGLYKIPPENLQFRNVLKLSNKGHNSHEKSFKMQIHPSEAKFTGTVNAEYKIAPHNMSFDRYGMRNNLRNVSRIHPIGYLKDGVSSPRLDTNAIFDLQRNLPELFRHIKNNVSGKQDISDYQGNYIPKSFKNLKETDVKAFPGNALISSSGRDMLQMYRLTTDKQWKPDNHEGPDITEGKIAAIQNLLRLLPEISKYKVNEQRADKDSKIVGKRLQDRLKAIVASRNISGSSALHSKVDKKLSLNTALGVSAKGRDKEPLKKTGQHYEMVQKMQGLLKPKPKSSYDDVVKRIYSDRYNMYSQLENDLENNRNYNYETEKSTNNVTTTTEENQEYSSYMPYQGLQHQAEQLENLSIPELRTEDIEEALQPALGTLSLILEDSLKNVSERDYGDQYMNYNDSDSTVNTETFPTLDLEELSVDVCNPSNRLVDMIDTTEPFVQNTSNIYSAVSEILSKAKGNVEDTSHLENESEVMEITPKLPLFNASDNGSAIHGSNNTIEPQNISGEPTTSKIVDETLQVPVVNRTENTEDSTINISNQICLQNAYEKRNNWSSPLEQMGLINPDDDVITVTSFISFDPTPCQLSQLMSESLRSTNNTCIILEMMRELLNIIIEKYHCDEGGLEERFEGGFDYENTETTTNGMDYENIPIYMLSYPETNQSKGVGSDNWLGDSEDQYLVEKMEQKHTSNDVAKYISDMLSELDKNANTSPTQEKYAATENSTLNTVPEMNGNISVYNDMSNVRYNQEDRMKQSRKLGHSKLKKDQCFNTLQTMEGLLKKLPDKAYYNVAKELQNELNYTFRKLQTDKNRPTHTEEVEYTTKKSDNHELFMTSLGGIPIIMESRKLPTEEGMVFDQNNLKDNNIQSRKYEANPVIYGEYNQGFRKVPSKYFEDSWLMDENPPRQSNTKNKALTKHNMKYGGLYDILTYSPDKSLTIEVSQAPPSIYTVPTGLFYYKGEGETDEKMPDLSAVTLDMIQTVPGLIFSTVKRSTLNVIPTEINYTYDIQGDPLNYFTLRTMRPEEVSEFTTYTAETTPELMLTSYPMLHGKNISDKNEGGLKYVRPVFSRDFQKGKLSGISSQPGHQLLEHMRYGGRERTYDKLDQGKGASRNNTMGYYNYYNAGRPPQQTAVDDIDILEQLLALQKLKANASFKENRTEANYSKGTQNQNSTDNFNTTIDVGVQTKTTEASKSRESSQSSESSELSELSDDDKYDMMQRKHSMAQPLFDDEFKRESERIFNDRYRMYNYLKKHSGRRLGLKELLLW